MNRTTLAGYRWISRGFGQASFYGLLAAAGFLPWLPARAAAADAARSATRIEGLSLDSANGSGVDVALGPRDDLFVSGLTGRGDLGTSASFQPAPRNNLLWGQWHSSVSHLKTDGTRLFAAYLGGTGPNRDSVYHVTSDKHGASYVTGLGDSRDFPLVHPFDVRTPQGPDIYVTKISPDGASVLYSSLLGGSLVDYPTALAANDDGELFVAGYTGSPDFPLAPGPVCLEATAVRGRPQLFIAKITAEGRLAFSTLHGDMLGSYIAQLYPDGSGGVWVVGGGHVDAPVGALPALDPGDAFVTHFDGSGTPLFSKSLGGTATDTATAILKTPEGDLIIAARSNSPFFEGVPAPLGAAGTQIPSTAVMLRLDPRTGGIRWSRRLATSEDSTIIRMAWLPDGKIAAVMTTPAPDSTPAKPVSETFVLVVEAGDGGVRSVVELPEIDIGPTDIALVGASLLRVAGSSKGRLVSPQQVQTADPVVVDMPLPLPEVAPTPRTEWASPHGGSDAVAAPWSGKDVLPVKLILEDWRGGVAGVDLYDGPVLLATWSHAPFTLSWTNPPAGDHFLVAYLRGRNQESLGTTSMHLSVVPTPTLDRFASRTPLQADDVEVTGSVLGCTQIPPLGAPFSLDACGNTAWFGWTPVADMPAVCEVHSSAVGTPEHLFLTVYDGNALDSLVTVGRAGTDGAPPRIGFAAKAGHAYSFRVEAAKPPLDSSRLVDSGLGLFGIRLRTLVAPSNDPASSPVELLGDPHVEQAGTTVAASGDPGDGRFHNLTASLNTVWYAWAAPATGPVVARATPATNGALYLRIGLPDGSQMPAQVVMDRGVVFNAVAGVRYLIGIATPPPGVDFLLAIDPAPPVVTAPIIESASQWDSTVTTLPAFPTVSQISPAWQWTAPETRSYRLAVDGDFLGGSLAVKSLGASVPLATAVSDPAATNAAAGHAELVFSAEQGQSYGITFTSAVRCVAKLHLEPNGLIPPNDNFSEAAPWPDSVPSVAGTTYGASEEPGERVTAHPQKTVWYSWVGSLDSPAVLSLDTDNTCPLMILYEGTSLDALKPVATNRADYTMPYSSTSGTEYRLQVLAACPSATQIETFALHRRFVAPNDESAGAIPLPSAVTAALLTVARATLSASDPQIPGSQPGSAWWSWSPPADGLYHLNLRGSETVPYLRFARKPPTGAPAFLKASQVYSNANALTLDVYYPLKATEVYMLELLSPCEQTFPLAVEAVPQHGNAAVESRLLLEGLPAAVDTSIEGAGAQSLWWSWTPPSSGVYEIVSQGSDFTPGFVVLDGPSQPQPVSRQYGPSTPVGAGRLLFYGEQGREAVIGVSTGPGTGPHLMFQVRTASSPANDAFSDALMLEGEDVEVAGQLLHATFEPGEPGAVSPFRGGSIWYSWTPPKTSLWYFGVSASATTSPWLAVFSGADLQSLNLLGTATAPGYQVLEVQGSVPLRLQVVGVDGSFSAPFQLHLIPQSPPVNDRLIDAVPIPVGAGSFEARPLWATLDPGESTSLSNPSYTNTLWYSFSPATTGTALFRGPDNDVGFGVFEGDSYPSLVRQPSTPVPAGGVIAQSFAVTAGRRYSLQIASPAGRVAFVVSYQLPDGALDQATTSARLSPTLAGRSPDWEFHLGVQEPTGTRTVLERSADLFEWAPVITNANLGQPLEIRLPLRTAIGSEFFRLRPE